MSREIFLRMYAMYSIVMTVRMVFTFSILTVAWKWYFPPILVVILAILNDSTILTISKDNVVPLPHPDSWKLREVFISSITFGLWLTLWTIVLFAIVNNSTGFESTGVENLCVGCMKNECHDFFQDQYQTCVMENNATGCGEMDGSVPQAARVSDLFEDLSDVHLNDLPNDEKPSAEVAYNQFVYAYTLDEGGAAYEGDYDAFAAAELGKSVVFIGNDEGAHHEPRELLRLRVGLQQLELYVDARQRDDWPWYPAKERVVGWIKYPTDRIAVIGCRGGYTLVAWLWATVWLSLGLIKFAVIYILTRNT
ncbi:hypothetical protein PHYBOEH_003956 [Phytophthora boehmeriae]|uniref:Uncharacterized protein n=1 Tax=Phytophthora boehmeriae TaxID=109152 RepID=A0A8T1WU36_9STRA|nr:hypothetical protein PHYBOEH_003956 [Phytophthora boehmeriae]